MDDLLVSHHLDRSMDERFEEPREAGKARRHVGAGRIWRGALRGLAVSVIAMLGLLPLASPAHALDLGLSPARIEQEVQPGHVMKGQLTVSTHGDAPIEARVYVMDLVIKADGDFEFLEPGMTQYSAATWIQLSREQVTVSPDAPAVIDYTITVPENAESGGRYAMVFCEAQQASEGTVQFVGRVGCQFLLTVPGAVNRHLAVGALQAPPVMLGLGGEAVAVQVVNDGNVHAIPAGYVQVTGGIPGIDRSWELSRVTLLPGASHTFRQELGELPWIGRVRIKSEVRYGPSATELTEGEVREVQVLIISWKILALIALVVVGTVFSVLRGRAQRRKRARLRRLYGRRAPRAVS